MSLIDKQNEVFAQRALRLLQLEELHAETGRILQEEIKRFARWMPKDIVRPTSSHWGAGADPDSGAI